MKDKTAAMSGAALILCALAAMTAASMPDDDPVPEAIKSLFGQRCAGGHKGRPMPPGKALGAEEIQALAAWIMSLK